MKGPVIHIFCIKILKYSEGQAARRVTACRLVHEIPELSEKIKKGLLNLTQLNQAKHFFAEENIKDSALKKEILEKLEGKTTRESEKILWELRGEEQPHKITITIREETLVQLRKVQSLKGHACPDLDSLLLKMSEEVTKIWTPVSKQKRTETAGHTRYVAAQVKAFVWNRDKGECRNCGSIFRLELDHIKAFGLGGKTTKANLQLLCRSCNQRKGFTTFNGRGVYT